MRHFPITVPITVIGLMLAGALLCPNEGSAQISMSNYTDRPPAVSSGVRTPNVLLMFDASTSMARFAAMEIVGDAGPGYWDVDNEYSGYFDTMTCYQYDAANKRFDPEAAKAALDTQCSNTQWDGNFLNWAVTQRFDVVKIAMTGGTCIDTATDTIGNRDASGLCLPSGSPAKKTITGLNKQIDKENGHRTNKPVKTGLGINTGPNTLDGRVPDSVQDPGGNDVYFRVRGGIDGMAGTFCSSTSSSAPADDATSCDDSGTAYNEQQFYVRVVMNTEPQGMIQRIGDSARFGLMAFTTDALGKLTVPIGSRQTRDWVGGSAIETFNSNMAAMIDAVDEAVYVSSTPTVEAMYEALRYYAQIGESGADAFHTLGFSPAGALGSTGTGSLGTGELSVLTGSETCPSGYIAGACGRDPQVFGSNHNPPWAIPSDVVTCCQNYIVLFTDGAPKDQTYLPASLDDYAQSVRGPDCCGIDPDDYDLIGLAYWGRIHDLRQNTVPVISETGHDVPGFQNVITYTFFAFGAADGRDLLQMTAKFGAFEDLNGNNEPDLVAEYDKVNNETGADGADGIPDAYYEARNSDEMKDKLTAAINAIIARSAAGGGASVQASSSSADGTLYQAFYFPSTLEGSRDIKWTGYAQSLFIDAFGNLREDTVKDGKLVYKEDQIVRFYFDSTALETLVDRFDDSDGNGLADSSTPAANSGVTLKELSPVWEGGERLANMASGSRNIRTWVDTDMDGVVDGGEQIAFSTANSTALAPYLRGSATPFTTDNIINFIRGDHIVGMRDRRLTVGGSLRVWKLGDSTNSTPVVVGAPAQRYGVIYGDPTYSTFFNKYHDRRQVIYLGANDGMLHAFNGGYYHPGDDPGSSLKIENGYFTRTPTDNSGGPLLGEELFGFIPQELLPHLRWLTQPDYGHSYYVDLTPKVVDARVFTPDADHPKGWGTILIGGFRMGGSCGACQPGTGAPPMTVTADWDYNAGTADTDRTFYSAYFVLDVTNPEAAGYPKLLWSFSSSDLGLTTSIPSMLRVNPKGDATIDDTNAKWYMIVGSGATGYDGSIAQTSKFFAIDLETGPGANNSQVVAFQAEPTDDSFLSATLTIDRNFDYRVDATYAGSVLHDGTLPWRGKLYRLTMNECTATPCSTSVWGRDDGGGGGSREPTELLDTFQGGTIELGPVSTRPAAAISDSNELWVFAGTGRFFGSSDKINTDTQYFVGVKDPVMTKTCTESTRTNCHANNLLNMSNAKVCVLGTGDCTLANQVENAGGATNFTSLISLVATRDGWYTALSVPGERVVAPPVVFAGIVLFPTFVPVLDPCLSSGESFLYALYYRTGSAYSAPVIGTTTGAGGKKTVNRSTKIGDGSASQVVTHVGVGGDSGKATAYVQTSTGEVKTISLDTQKPLQSRFMSWHEGGM